MIFAGTISAGRLGGLVEARGPFSPADPPHARHGLLVIVIVMVIVMVKAIVLVRIVIIVIVMLIVIVIVIVILSNGNSDNDNSNRNRNSNSNRDWTRGAEPPRQRRARAASAGARSPKQRGVPIMVKTNERKRQPSVGFSCYPFSDNYPFRGQWILIKRLTATGCI